MKLPKRSACMNKERRHQHVTPRSKIPNSKYVWCMVRGRLQLAPLFLLPGGNIWISVVVFSVLVRKSVGKVAGENL